MTPGCPVASQYDGRMATGTGGDAPESIGDELARRGFALRRHVVPDAVAERLARDIDRALEVQHADFPEGDAQHGRLLFAPEHGGAFLDLLDHDPLFAPLEDLVDPEAIVYTMTTSVVTDRIEDAARTAHRDVDARRPDGLVLAAIVLLDAFSPRTGATEFFVGSHAEGDRHEAERCVVEQVAGDPGDVCFFDPRILHRSGVNATSEPRRALLVAMAKPWMKQRVDVAAMFDASIAGSLGPKAARRLGLASLPPASRAEFLARRRSGG